MSDCPIAYTINATICQCNNSAVCRPEPTNVPAKCIDEPGNPNNTKGYVCCHDAINFNVTKAPEGFFYKSVSNQSQPLCKGYRQVQPQPQEKQCQPKGFGKILVVGGIDDG